MFVDRIPVKLTACWLHPPLLSYYASVNSKMRWVLTVGLLLSVAAVAGAQSSTRWSVLVVGVPDPIEIVFENKEQLRFITGPADQAEVYQLQGDRFTVPEVGELRIEVDADELRVYFADLAASIDNVFAAMLIDSLPSGGNEVEQEFFAAMVDALIAVFQTQPFMRGTPIK